MAEEINKQVIVSIGVDAGQANQEITDVQTKLNNLGNVDTSKSVRTLKQELKEAQIHAQKMFVEFGNGSKEFNEAAKKLADVKDQMEEMNLAVKNFNPGNKLQSLVSIAKGATGALQGVQGAMAFVGVESENAAATMAKLQGLMAFSDALNSVGDMKDSFKNFTAVLGLTGKQAAATSTAIQGQTAATQGATVATKGFGAAFKAIGIGLIISAIAALVTNFDAIKATVLKAVPALGSLGEIFNKVKAIAFGVGNVLLKYIAGPIQAVIKAIQGDFSGALDVMKNSFNVVKNFQEGYDNEVADQKEDKRKEELTKELKHSEDQIAILKARGRDTYAVESANFKKKLTLYKEDSEEYKKIKQEQAVFEAGHQKDLEDKAKAASDKAEAKRKADAEKIKALLEKEAEIYKNHQKEISTIIDEGTKEILKSKMNERDAALFDINDQFNQQKKVVDQNYKEDLDILKNQLKYKAITKEQYNQKVLELDKKSEQATLVLAEQKGIKELEVQKKYNGVIQDYINQYNTTAHEQAKAKLIKDFDEKIALADEKQKALLEKLKLEAVNKLETNETNRKNTINTETTFINVQTDNAPEEKDSAAIQVQKLQNIYEAEKAFKDAKFQEELAKLEGDEAAINLLKAKKRQEDQEDEKKNSEAKKAIWTAEKEAKLGTLQAVGQAANTLGDLIGKQTVAGKALAVAQATIDTFVGANKAIAQGGIAGIASAVAVIATGLMNVKKIVSTKVPAKGGDTAQAPAVSTAPVVQAALTQAATAQVQDVRVVNQQNQVVKAYVTDRDLKDNEQKSNFLNSLSSI